MVRWMGILWVGCGGQQGATRLFEDQTYHYEALRSVGYAPSGGADVNEVLHALGEVSVGDAQSWHAAWSGLGDRALARADRYTSDARGRGEALLVGANYLRTAEFLLPPDDPKKLPTYRRSLDGFYRGLDALQIVHEPIEVPYGDGRLDGLFVPGDARRGHVLIVVINGFDSTKEEAFFAFGRGASARGLSFLSYDGPGQGTAIRERGMPLVPDWAPVNEALLDAVTAAHPEIEHVVLVGFSLGSVLATKAAAEDPRVDLLVQYDIMRDFSAVAREEMPASFAELVFSDAPDLEKAQRQLERGMARSAELDWAMRHGAWILGTGDGYAAALRQYRLFNDRLEAPLVTQPVLLLVGESDHFVPERMLAPTQAAFRDATTLRYDYASGGDEHCQVGATSRVQGDVYDWVFTELGLE